MSDQPLSERVNVECQEEVAALEAERDRLRAELKDRTDRFQNALDKVMDKNRELYERLALVSREEMLMREAEASADLAALEGGDDE